MKQPRIFCFLLSFFLVFFGVFGANVSSAHAESVCSIPLDLSPLSGFFFLGESTTAHLKARSPLPREQVLTNESGTMRLDSTLLSRPINHPKSGEHVKLPDLLRENPPSGIFLSFGLNGILGFCERPSSYTENYRRVIRSIRESAPQAVICVQAIYPVARSEHQSDWPFSKSPSEINEMILCLNRLLPDLCNGEGVYFVDAATCLRDADGYLYADYTTDGIHLTDGAYLEILQTLVRFVSKEIQS